MKRFYLLLILFICILSISAASAIDISADSDQFNLDSVNQDNHNNEKLILDENINQNNYNNQKLILNEDINQDQNNKEPALEEKNTSSKTSLKDGTYTFTDLNNTINNNELTTITLYSDYTFGPNDSPFKDGIIISRSLTIDGQGHSINGNNQSRIFYIDSYDKITFKNINFINGHVEGSNGGAICPSNTNMDYTAINCSFSNNIAKENEKEYSGLGGALSYGTAIDCNFIENTAYKGGALYHGTAINSTFTKNTAYHGGALSNATAINSTFTKNTANLGGALHYSNATNCNFIQNKGPYGGALYYGTATNCNFSQNNGTMGGAMHYGTAANCNFSQNYGDYGGAIYGGKANQSTFSQNSGDYGWAMAYGKSYDCRFIFNSANNSDTDTFSQENENPTFIRSATLSAYDFICPGKSGDRLLFNLTSEGENLYGINVTIDIYENGEYLATYYGISGEGWPVDLMTGTYDATLSVDKANVEPITIRITANPLNPNLTVTSNKIYANDSNGLLFTISLKKDARGELNLTGDIKKEIKITEEMIRDGKIIIEIRNDEYPAGKYNVTFTYLGDGIYYNSTVSSIAEIKKIDTKVIPKNKSMNLIIDDVSKIEYSLNPNNAIGNISFKSNATNVLKVDNDGKIIAIGKGKARVTINFSGSDNYASSNATVNITVNKKSTKLTASNISSVYNREGYLEAVLKDSKNNPIGGVEVICELNGKNKYNTSSNGSIKVPTKGLAGGNHTAIIIFEGNNIYSPTNATAKVRIDKDSSKLNAINLTTTYKKDDYLILTLKDSTNNPIRGAELSVELNNKAKYTTDSSGQVKVPTKGLSPNNYNALIVFSGNENYTGTNTRASVIVKRGSTSFNYTDLNTIAFDSKIDGRVGDYFRFQLLNDNGKPLSDKLVFIGFNGVKYNRTTNETGEARLQINLKYANHYTFAIAFLGDDNYSGSFNVALISVTEQVPSLSASAKTYKASAKTKVLTATLKSSRGKALAGKRITFTLNGKVYSANTNSQGLASVKVSLSKKGTYSFTVQYGGDSTYKKVTKSSKLTIK